MLLVRVDLKALRALVAKVRELDEWIADDRAMTMAERKPSEAEIQQLVDALGVQGLREPL